MINKVSPVDTPPFSPRQKLISLNLFPFNNGSNKRCAMRMQTKLLRMNTKMPRMLTKLLHM